MLDVEERRRRIVAARTLRGISQTEMDELGREQGLAKQELSRLERGEFGDRFSTVHAHTLSRVLRVPVTWFNEESVDAIVGYIEPDKVRTIAEIERLLLGLGDVARELRQEAGESAPGEGGTGHSQGGQGGAGT